MLEFLKKGVSFPWLFKSQFKSVAQDKVDSSSDTADTQRMVRRYGCAKQELSLAVPKGSP